MNANHHNPSMNENECLAFEPLISAWIDGELSSEEQVRIEDHILQCQSCRKLKREFENIDRNVACHEFSDVINEAEYGGRLTHAVSANSDSVREKQNFNSNWAWLAIAASLLLAISFAVTPRPSEENEQLVENIAQPLADLHMLKLQKQRDEKLMLKTLELDLRSLRLELSQLDPDLATRKMLSEKIDNMMQRVSHFDASAGL